MTAALAVAALVVLSLGVTILAAALCGTRTRHETRHLEAHDDRRRGVGKCAAAPVTHRAVRPETPSPASGRTVPTTPSSHSSTETS